ncbi:MAG: DNA topoisomerase (ATP-hydrolyzing) subunit B [Candidatus Brocadiia bacterium]
MAEEDKEKDRYNASSIRVLGGIEHVRLRPAMYIGDTAQRGLHHLFEEVVANSIDEAMVGQCTEIAVRLYSDGSISLMDNGRGIPVDRHPDTGKPALEVVMTTLNAGGKFDKNSYKVSAGLHGVGVSCVNALSKWMEVEVWRDDHMYYQRYERGEPQTPVEKRGRSNRRGTRVTFKPDPEIFDPCEFDSDRIGNRLRELAFLNSGTRIVMSQEGESDEEEFHYEEGITEFVAYLNREKDPVHSNVISLEDEEDGKICEVALQYNQGFNEVIFSFANNINTVDGGTHLSGFRTAVTRTFNNWARDNDELKDVTPTGDDYREGLTAVVSVKLPEPQFEGQTKTRLGNRGIKSLVEQAVGEKLSVYCEEHPGIVRTIVKKAVEAARARKAAKKARDLTRRKGALSRGNLPTKLRDCSSKKREETELFIVEGQSAGGTASMGRDRQFQAILPLRGVILNVEKARVDKMLGNEEIATLITALGTGIGTEEFDLERLRYDKVVIMTDADIDGAHIRTLLLTFFFRQMPRLIEHGHLYIAQPPLYCVKRSGKKQYVHDDRALQDALIELGSKEATLEYSLNGEDSGAQLDPVQFRNLLDQLTVLDGMMHLVEQHGIPFGDFLGLRDGKSGDRFPLYRVVHTDREGEEHQKFFYSEAEYDDFVRDLSARLEEYEEELEIIEEDDYEGLARTRGEPNVVRPHKFHQSGRLSSVVREIESCGIPIDTILPPEEDQEPAKFTIKSDDEERTVGSLSHVVAGVREIGREGLSIDRYKGLGEMNATELGETTLDPETRTIVQVTVGDAIEADNYFSILAGKDVKRRREFIEMHALEASNLDV